MNSNPRDRRENTMKKLADYNWRSHSWFCQWGRPQEKQEFAGRFRPGMNRRWSARCDMKLVMLPY